MSRMMPDRSRPISERGKGGLAKVAQLAAVLTDVRTDIEHEVAGLQVALQAARGADGDDGGGAQGGEFLQRRAVQLAGVNGGQPAGGDGNQRGGPDPAFEMGPLAVQRPRSVLGQLLAVPLYTLAQISTRHRTAVAFAAPTTGRKTPPP